MGRIILQIPKDKRVAAKKKKAVEEEITVIEEEISLAPIETNDVISIMQGLSDKVSTMRTEVKEIWKYLAQVTAQEIIDAPEREAIINTLQDVIEKLK